MAEDSTGIFKEISRVTRELTASCTDQWSRRILALAGFDTYERSWPGILPPWRILKIAPLLLSRVRTAERLEMALQGVLGEDLEGARVTVKQFVGRWVDIDARTRLGQAHHQLGRNMLLGSRAFDRMGRFQVEIGPLSPRAYRRLRQSGAHYVVDTIADLLPCIDDIEARLRRGERP